MHSKVPDFRRLGVFQMMSPRHNLEKKGIMPLKGVEFRALGVTLFTTETAVTGLHPISFTLDFSI